MDPVGLMLFFPAIFCILLDLQWAGAFCIEFTAFVVIQAYMGDGVTGGYTTSISRVFLGHHPV